MMMTNFLKMPLFGTSPFHPGLLQSGHQLHHHVAARLTARPALSTGAPSSSKTSPAPSLSRGSSRTSSPNVSRREASPSSQLTQQRTGTWEETYTGLDADAKKLTEALEEFQCEFERKQDVTRQQPGLTRSASLTQAEPKAKRHALPPVRKSDPLIDPISTICREAKVPFKKHALHGFHLRTQRRRRSISRSTRECWLALRKLVSFSFLAPCLSLLFQGANYDQNAL